MIASEMIATRSEIVAERGVVAGGHAQEAEAGVAALRAGGNAIDAVVAAAFAGFVVEPASCGLGGYGRLAIWLGPERRFVTIDHYARAPAAGHAEMFEIDPTKPDKYYGFPHTKGMRAERGALAAAVPGAVAGLCAAHARHGRLPLARVLEPAIGFAESGVAVDATLQLVIAGRLAEIREQPAAAAFLLRDDAPPAIAGQFGGGDRLDTGALARTLKRIAERGAAGFHEGPVAEAIERASAEVGGVLRASDLAAYRPRILHERPSRYRGHDYVTAYDQVGIEALNILECFDLARHGPDSAAFRHLVAEALARAFIDSMTHYGDPDFEQSPVQGLASPDFARARAAKIALDRTLPRPVSAADPWPFENAMRAPEKIADAPARPPLGGTSQMAAADSDGNMATLCTSLSSGFGSLIYVPEIGVMLNNCMQNFDPRPHMPNRIRPGKMPIFAVPTLVAARDSRAVFGAAGSGGYRITTAVLHPLMHVVDFGMSLQAAVDAPRVHCQGDDTFVDARIPAEVRAALAALGHRVVVQRDTPGVNCFGRVAAVSIDDGGALHAATWPPWQTAAAGW
jgi:gamma-glutamyltranspeptidase/glutathione hydrolase